jgi:hypothetical protein
MSYFSRKNHAHKDTTQGHFEMLRYFDVNLSTICTWIPQSKARPTQTSDEDTALLRPTNMVSSEVASSGHSPADRILMYLPVKDSVGDSVGVRLDPGGILDNTCV